MFRFIRMCVLVLARRRAVSSMQPSPWSGSDDFINGRPIAAPGGSAVSVMQTSNTTHSWVAGSHDWHKATMFKASAWAAENADRMMVAYGAVAHFTNAAHR
jgi:hypothetical protein